MSVTDYDLLYDLPAGEYEGRGIEGVKTTTIRAGQSLEVMIAPTFKWTGEARREAKRRRSTPAMQIINDRNTERKMMRYAEHNFTSEAVVFTLTYAYPPTEDYGLCNLRELTDTYEQRGLPWDVERVRKDARNFREKAKRLTARCGGKPAALKWMQRIEEGKQPPAENLPPKYHIHGIMEGAGITLEALEALWPFGTVQVAHFDLDNDGAKRLANYLCKQKQGGRWWSHSRNLKAPPERVSRRKVSRRRLMLLATEVQRDGQLILEDLYPGYKMRELIVRFSDFAPGAYIYVRLRKQPTAPPWLRARGNKQKCEGRKRE